MTCVVRVAIRSASESTRRGWRAQTRPFRHSEEGWPALLGTGAVRARRQRGNERRRVPSRGGGGRTGRVVFGPSRRVRGSPRGGLRGPYEPSTYALASGPQPLVSPALKLAMNSGTATSHVTHRGDLNSRKNRNDRVSSLTANSVQVF